MGTKIAKLPSCGCPTPDEARAQQRPSTAAQALFATVQRRLLALLYGQPDREFHVRELERIAGSGAGATHRELRRLAAGGLLRTRTQLGLKLHQADPECPSYADLVQLVRNSFGLVDPLQRAFASLEARLEAAFVFETVERSGYATPPLDLLLVSLDGPIDFEAIELAREYAEQRLSRDLRVLLLEPGELRQPREFVAKVLAKPRTWVFGHEKRLRAMTSGP